MSTALSNATVESLNAESVSGLWREHRSRLRSFIVKRVPDRDIADDILQDVFLKALDNMQTVRTHGSVSAWLYRVATNAIADYYRSRKPVEELPEDLFAPERETDYVAELAVCLEPFIAQLPEIYRTAVMMAEIEGKTQREVARELGISLSGVKSRVQRGREKLRQRLSLCCEIETGRNGIVGYEIRRSACSCTGA